jgi:SAM-dependent methyltransferase
MTKDEYKEFFEKALFPKYGDSPKSLDFGSRDTQFKRFKVLVEIGLRPGDSVLDAGCGLGHMVEFLRRYELPVHYTGYDVSKIFISHAKQKNLSSSVSHNFSVEFEVKDLFKDPISTTFDWVLCSAFNLMTPRLAKKLFEACTKGTAINFLSSYAKKKSSLFAPELIFPHLNPAKVFTLYKKKITPWVILCHDYLPHDFTIYMYRSPQSRL